MTHDLGLEVDVRTLGSSNVIVRLLLREFETVRTGRYSPDDRSAAVQSDESFKEPNARLERLVMLLERLVRESCPDLADHLVRAALGVEAGEVERAVDVRALALAVVAADDDEVERVADALEVVLLELLDEIILNQSRVPATASGSSSSGRRTLSQWILLLLGS